MVCGVCGAVVWCGGVKGRRGDWSSLKAPTLRGRGGEWEGLFFDVFTSGLHVILTTGSAQHSYGVHIDAAELRHFIMTEVSISLETQP